MPRPSFAPLRSLEQGSKLPHFLNGSPASHMGAGGAVVVSGRALGIQSSRCASLLTVAIPKEGSSRKRRKDLKTSLS